jgi:holo-[acyl-carrier protein] synthase
MLTDERTAERRAVSTALRSMAVQLLDPPIGVGIDVVDVHDFERVTLERYPGFYNRCFSGREIAYCRSRARPAEHFAVRFAAKEAAVKALAVHQILGYWQIEVERRPDGRPELALWTFDRTAPLSELNGLHLRVSLSHAESWAAAFVAVYNKDTAHAGT